MKTPKMFILEKNLKPKIERLLKAPKLGQTDEGCEVQIAWVIRKGHQAYEFPLNEAEIKNILKKLPSEDLIGLKKIVVTSPSKNKEYGYLGRYEPGMIYLFMHLKRDGKFITWGEVEEYSVEEFRKKAIYAVIHEVGHHVGINQFGVDSEGFADTYAEGKLEKILEIS